MNIATIRAGEWIKVIRAKHPLNGEVLEVLEVDLDERELKVFHEGTGVTFLKPSEVGPYPKPKTSKADSPPTTPDNTVARIKSLIERYRQIGGKIDRQFVEEILPDELVEEIFKSHGSTVLDNKSSTSYDCNKSSTKHQEIGDRSDTSFSVKKPGRPKGATNKTPASGWVDTRYNNRMGTTNYYWCVNKYKWMTAKISVPSHKVETVRQMINLKVPAEEIENYLKGKEEIIF
ncbi:MAG: hypothetical protein F6K48_14275 [Okeania sp. SIO3H1]|uniref:hypothetical protein n=1 Tax=Okeania sp. SIO1I7 TaxID=2607772 RepID=UPI0013C6E885|nr:hypothetical protein [Okeania sp. SIO1I7]NEN90012.1 hypothetical protein [Okeania sp. SIO3H1]NET24973.1 hypothetical protein [Okeania sp. SIO1I7]